jgi:hypothetical protein
VLRVIWLLSVIRVIRLLVMQLVFACGCLWLLVVACVRFWSLVVACGWLLVVLSVIHLPGC